MTSSISLSVTFWDILFIRTASAMKQTNLLNYKHWNITEFVFWF